MEELGEHFDIHGGGLDLQFAAATATITATPSTDVSGPESARSSRCAVTSTRPASRSGRSARAARDVIVFMPPRSPTRRPPVSVQPRGLPGTPPVCRRYGQHPLRLAWGRLCSPSQQTRYVKSGDAHIAYQVVGDGPADLIVVRGYISHVEVAWESPALARVLSAVGVVLPADPVRQARHGPVRPGARGPPADARAADGRRARRDGGRRVRPRGAPRRVGGRPDVPAVRRHLPRAHARAAAVGLLRPLRLATRLHRALLGRRHGGRRARSARARVG